MALADKAAYAVAAWSFDESSGTRSDQVGTYDATESGGTVNSTTGILGSAASLVSTPYLTVADNAALEPGSSAMGIRLWVKLNSKSADSFFIRKWGSGTESWIVYYHQFTDRFRFILSNTGGVDGEVYANNLGSPSTGTWYLLHCRKISNQIGIAVNAGTEDTGIANFDVRNTSATIDFGFGSSDCVVDDPVFMIGEYLDATERTEDYNSGAGVAFADWAGGGGATTRGRPFGQRGTAFNGGRTFQGIIHA